MEEGSPLSVVDSTGSRQSCLAFTSVWLTGRAESVIGAGPLVLKNFIFIDGISNRLSFLGTGLEFPRYNNIYA